MEKIKTKLGLMDRLQWRRASQGFEARDREAVKLGKIWRRWTEATVKSEQGQDRWTKEVM
jgi:hypothetical protein